MPGVSLSHVSRTFGSYVAVDDVSLDIADGEFVTLLGPSGCGKTTTLRMVAGLETASAGRISIADAVVDDASTGRLVAPEKRGLGMVFQSYAIWPHMTVYQNVAYPLEVRRWRRAAIRERVAKILEQVEMAHLAQRPATALSGGQQQRVAIARALVADPSVLLLDEPLSNLDARLRLQMGDDLRALQVRTGVTTIYVTHDQTEAMALSDRVVVMSAGKLLQIGAPTEIYHRPDSRAVAAFFGTPNFFDVTVTGSEPHMGRHRVEVEARGWKGAVSSAIPAAPGQEAVVMIRPEDFVIEGAATGADSIRIAGTVREAIFRGTHHSMGLDTPDGPLRAELPSHAGAVVGDTLRLAAATSSAWLLPNSLASAGTDKKASAA